MKQFNVTFENRQTGVTNSKVLLAKTWHEAIDCAYEHHKGGGNGEGKFRIKGLSLVSSAQVIVAGCDGGDE